MTASIAVVFDEFFDKEVTNLVGHKATKNERGKFK
jgi:hypothetical protein